MSRTVAGQRRDPHLPAAPLGTRELALETVAGVAVQVEVRFVRNETVVNPAGVELDAVQGFTLLQASKSTLADPEATLLVVPRNLNPRTRWNHLLRHLPQ